MGDFGKTRFGVIVCLLVFGSKLVLCKINSLQCPPAEDISPCMCQTGFDGVEVHCNGLQSHSQLKNIIEELKDHKIGHLVIQKSNLGDVPGDIFKGTNIWSILIMYNKNLTSLGDDVTPPFSGLEESLSDLHINDEKLLTEPLRLGHLKKLTHLVYYDMEIPKLGNDWFSDGPESLTNIRISNCGVKEVGDKTFSSLKNLKYLGFSGNFDYPRRSALPRPALHLQILYLATNNIYEFSSDFFKDMPALRKVILWNNKLTHIPQHTWGSILPQLSIADLSGNPLVCDSELKWILSYERNILGICDLPKKLNGKAVHSLKTKDLD